MLEGEGGVSRPSVSMSNREVLLRQRLRMMTEQEKEELLVRLLMAGNHYKSPPGWPPRVTWVT